MIPLLTYIGQLPPLSDENRHHGPYALILAPTRELAQQIESETRKFATPLGYTCVSIVGGRSVEEQQYNLRDGAEIIIATPGRLKDILDRHVIVLSQCSYIVMDEADRMVDLGFEEELTYILDKLPVAEEGKVLQAGDEGWRITTLFSATMPPAVERISKKYLRKPAVVTIGVAGQVRRLSSRISRLPFGAPLADLLLLRSCRPSTPSSSASSSSLATRRRRRGWSRSCARAASSRR